MAFYSWSNTCKGRVRAQNQDSVYVNDKAGIWLIADGMGGHAAGDFASNLISQELPRLLLKGEEPLDAISSCHKRLIEAEQSDAKYRGMGTTLILGLWRNNTLSIYWVGDSRAYILSDDNIQLLTKDHTVVQKLIDLNLLSEDLAAHHPDKNKLTQCLGGGNNYPPQVSAIEINVGNNDTLLLCSDGLYNELNAKQMHKILHHSNDKESSLKQLFLLANAAGGRDNISAVILNRIM
ncbi:PP2C family serine/threonine-protein phosphatase [Glaciecola sp. SC05]|uniref:PP2C family protein-serine/threonine phosphatase n=1 Tax=Glaciecola sp. SC05 TaxID=1987355 RepID=UPI00352705B9